MEEKMPPIIKFLLGEAEYEGKWYGDSEEGKPFWWREPLRELFTTQREDGFLKALDEKIKESKFISNKRKMAYYRGHYVALTELRDLYLSVTSKNKER